MVVASITGLIAPANKIERKWAASELVYVAPDVPSQFDKHDQPFNIHFGVSGPTVEYKNGRSMYMQNYRMGWENCRR